MTILCFGFKVRRIESILGFESNFILFVAVGSLLGRKFPLFNIKNNNISLLIALVCQSRLYTWYLF